MKEICVGVESLIQVDFKKIHFITLLVIYNFLATTIWWGSAFPVAAKGHRQNVSDELFMLMAAVRLRLQQRALFAQF